jgi:flagellar basal-body rod protein FlgB
MLNGLFDNSTIPYLNEAVNFAQARHNVLVGNVANIDTPGYKTRDLSVETFQERLAEAIQARQERHESLTSPLLSTSESEALRRVRESMTTVLRHDDVDVGIEQQVKEISKNQMLHNLAVTIMTNQFQLLQTMISERL